MTYSYTDTVTFTVTHARYLASKIATDLHRMQRFYGKPNDSNIADYEAEATELMKAGYLEKVYYGYKRSGNWIEPTLIYTARDLADTLADDEDPGRVPPRADVVGATFSSFLIYSDKWWDLPVDERITFEDSLPVHRTTGSEPGVNGYLVHDRTYSSGGRALDRSVVRGY